MTQVDLFCRSKAQQQAAQQKQPNTNTTFFIDDAKHKNT
jgi:hypothetical protein